MLTIEYGIVTLNLKNFSQNRQILLRGILQDSVPRLGHCLHVPLGPWRALTERVLAVLLFVVPADRKCQNIGKPIQIYG